MLGATIVMSMLAGIGTSCAAPYASAHVAVLERCGGVLMVGALALLGAALPGVI
jgi:hypothetical protein